MRRLVQIVPMAPPMVSGVGDYALALAAQLRDRSKIESTFIVCSARWTCPDRPLGFEFRHVRKRSAEELVAALLASGAEPTLLHLSPYGFEANGVPAWLERALSQWKQATRQQLITYFHELYATGMPWQRSFWMTAFQRRCTREILRLSDHALTSTDRYDAILRRWEPGRSNSIASMPIPSNMGEPDCVPALDARKRELIVWGSAKAKREALSRRHRATLERCIRSQDIESVTMLGEPLDGMVPTLAGVPVFSTGVISAADVRVLLARAALGAFVYNPNFLGKSSLFAAFCAHGLPTLCLQNRPLEPRSYDGLRAGIHFLTSIREERREAIRELSTVADNALRWYSTHGVARHGEKVASLLKMPAHE